MTLEVVLSIRNLSGFDNFELLASINRDVIFISKHGILISFH